MYVYDVEEFGELDGNGNDSSEPVDNDSEHDAESDSFAVSEPESGGESRTKSESERKPETGAESVAFGANAEPDSVSKPQPPDVRISHKKAREAHKRMSSIHT